MRQEVFQEIDLIFYMWLLLQANITVEEYALMYKVYQKSVRQTETLKELRKIRDDAQLNTMKELSFNIKPSGKFS